MELYFLGASMPHWAGPNSPLLAPAHPGGPPQQPIPLCMSRVRLAHRKTLPRAQAPVLIDSGGFSELDPDEDQDGYTTWSITPRQYIAEVRRYVQEIGHVVGAAPMDYMTEPHIRAATGLTEIEHLARSVTSTLELRWLDPDLPIFPVIQGNSIDAQLRCADMYEKHGIDLTKEPLVGVGSVCRLQSTVKIVDRFAALHHHFGGNIRLHGFGVKKLGLKLIAPGVVSGDSAAGSRRGRSAGPCTHGSGAVSEANCPVFARQWYEQVLHAATQTTAAQWEAVVAQYAARGTTAALFDVAGVEHGPNMPTPGWRIARTLSTMLPADADVDVVAGLLDRFQAAYWAQEPVDRRREVHLGDVPHGEVRHLRLDSAAFRAYVRGDGAAAS
ncbi:deazapurine DNA modification protein DpdA family protein [Actinomadura violacea]|uniref:DeoxyPurine in DNA protein A domain-containing protein n=1 Tax=Actinomadura violacea TaxID=2819934 RepID=A0ABS3RXV6_9ACTN|nr:hypothetical protein [Actinomadura violacea]MBO2461587.1 hypothetical protein [Actinomadura violacea]